MARTEKVAVTVDGQVLAATERLRQRTGESRSAVVTRALKLLVAEERRRLQATRYIEAYRESPETEEEIAAAAALAKISLEGVSW